MANSNHTTKIEVKAMDMELMPLKSSASAPDDSGDRVTPEQMARYEVESLCSHMMWLRSWWGNYGEAITAALPEAARTGHDHFIEGVLFARSVNKTAGFNLGEHHMHNYSWGRSTQTVRMIGGAT